MDYFKQERRNELHEDYLNRRGDGYRSKAGMVVGIFLLTASILMELIK